MVFKVLIADDEEGMRRVLKKIIDKVEGFEPIGEAEDGEAALRLFDVHKPHIVFMDVEMPQLSGIECAKKIMDINPKTFVIFATAHNEYMPEAFGLYAFDYLVKPFKIERVIQTLERIRELNSRYEGVSVNSAVSVPKGLSKLLIRNKEGISLVGMEDIILIQREERSTVIYTADERYVTSDALSEIEERLDRNLFFRTHKSYIVNLSMIHKIYPYGRWTYIIKLRNTDRDALLTHDRYEELQRLFE